MTGVTVSCLMDTGSMVSTLSEEFYKTKIASQPLREPEGWLKLHAANGLEVPYLGLVVLDVTIEGTPLDSVGCLIVK